MDRTELTLVATIALIVAVLIGWGLRWIYELLNPAPPPEPIADSEWAEYAKAWEAQRDWALAEKDRLERELTQRLKETQAERDAAMESLGSLRARIAELEGRDAS